MSAFEWLRVIAPILMLVITALLAVAGYFGKKMIDGFGHELYKVRRRQDESEKDFLRFQAVLPREFVLKDDHIRHMTIIENKIDEQGRETQGKLGEINQDIKAIFRELPKRKTDAET